MCTDLFSRCVNIPSLLLLLLQLSLQLHLLLLRLLLPPHPFLQQRSPLLSHVLLCLSILLSRKVNIVSQLPLFEVKCVLTRMNPLKV